jgi:hypothetical protein
MRVLQTIGSHEGLPTPFYYGRGREGVRIEQIRGQDTTKPFDIPSTVWQEILDMIADSPTTTFAVTDRHNNPAASSENLYERLHRIFSRHQIEGLNDSLLAYVSAILLHEGSLQLYHGRIGPDREARIVLRRPTSI